MQFERLRKSHKKQIIIGALAICVIGGALTFATTKAKYKLTESIDLVKGTINYKPYDFKIMAMYQQNDSGDYTETNTMPNEGYVINEEKTYCTTDNKTKVKGKAHTNDSGELVFKNLTKSDKCYLYFDKLKTIPDIIATLNAKTTTPDFSQVATSDEGVYAVSDEMYGGTSYYWRGATTTNYVKFANFCWRIVRINGDGSMRLIYDGATCHANGTITTDSIIQSTSGTTVYKYNSNKDRSEYVGWTYAIGSQRTLGGTASNVKTQTDTWFNNNITGTNLSKVADGKFCNDRNTASGSTWETQLSSTFYYAARERLETNKAPTFSCPSGDVYTMKAGAITADEVAYAGGVNGPINKSYYLCNGQYYWTMTPHRWYYATPSNRYAIMFIVNPGGTPNDSDVFDPRSIRPVINLKSDTKFQSGGNGTLSNPYVVS